MTTIDLKAHLRATTERAHKLLVKDLTAISTEHCLASPGGCARTAVNIVAECAAVNGLVAQYLQTGERTHFSPEEREAHLASFDTAEKVLTYLEQTTQSLYTAIDALDVDTLGEEIHPFGRPMTRLAVAELPAWHMGYHDGQLNYIQTLHGDDESHWG